MNKKNCFVLCVVTLIIFLSVGMVFASDNVNTTDDELLYTTSGDIGGVNEELMMEHSDINDEVASDFTDDISDVASESNNDDEILTSDNNDEEISDVESGEVLSSLNSNTLKMNNDNNKEILSSSNSEILELNNDNDLLSSDARINSVSFSTTSATISYYIESWSRNVKIYARVGTSSFVDEDLTLTDKINMNYYYSGTISVPGTYSPGNVYDVVFGIEGEDSDSTTASYPMENPTVTVSSKSITYNSGTYSVSGTCSVNGLTITLKAGSTTLGSTTSSSGSWTVSSISSTLVNVGSYTLTATSTKTSSYASASGTNTLTVSKNSPNLYVYSKSVDYNSGTYSISGSCSINGLSITLKVGSTSIGSATVSSGSWSYSGISSTKFNPGSYTIYASYGGSTNYYSDSDTATLTVSKSTPTIVISNSPNIVYGDGVYSVSGTAKIIKSSNSYNVGEGTVTLKCGDTVLGTSSVSGGEWMVSNIDSKLVDPKSTSYTITAYYESNTYYNEASSTNSLTVSKFTPNIIINPVTIFYNQTDNGVLSGRVYMYDGSFYESSIDLYVDDVLVGSNIAVSGDGYWNYTLSSTNDFKPSATAYTVKVEYNGNSYTESQTLSENKYMVNKGITYPTIQSTGTIDKGRTEYIYVYVTNIMGNGYLSGIDVTLKGTGIDGTLTNTSDSNGMATFSFSDLEKGKYDDWKVSIMGNDYYSGRDNVAVSTFYVQSPLSVFITNVTPSNSTFPDELIVNGYVDADVNLQGNVTLIMGDKTYIGLLDSNGNFTTSLIGVKPGTYNNITAKYNPTEDEFYYRGVESTVSIPETIINKFLPVVVLDCVNVNLDYYPGNVTVSGHVTYVNNQIPTGRIEIIYNGKVYTNATLNDAGEFTVDAVGLPRGEYNLSVVYTGDDYYLDSANSTDVITVNPSPVNFTISVSNGTYNVDEISTVIDVALSGLFGGDDIPKGIVRLEVGDRYWNIALDDDGKATIVIKSLNAGDYSDSALKYIVSDDEMSYDNSSTVVDFSVYKADPGLSVRAPTIGAGKDGTIYITLHDNVSGLVHLIVGKPSDAKYVNIYLNVTAGANRTYNITSPPVGANQVVVNYTGDVNFNSSIAETMLYIERPESYLNYIIGNMTYGDKQLVEFTVYSDEDLSVVAGDATGKIYVYNLGEDCELDVSEGRAFLLVENLNKGDYRVIAFYGGNDKWGASRKNTQFTVSGLETTLIVSVDNDSIIAGEDIVVSVFVNDTINDIVRLFVDGHLYYSNTTVNGMTNFVLHNLTCGSHNITALFSGNDAFEGADNNATVTVNRINANPDITVTHNRDIVFDITVPGDADGYIRIVGNTIDEIMPIINNKATLTLDKVTRGDYTFNIIYEGNWKYLPFDVEKSFAVDFVCDYVLNISSTPGVFNKTVNITVTAISDLEGKTVNLTVDGLTKSTATVINGVAVFSNVYLVSNTSGEFEITASYDGDSIYTAKSFTTMVPVIPTDDYILDVEALSIVNVGDNIVINITAPELINTVNFTINGKTYLVNRNNFTYHIDDIDEGTYNIAVSYAGDKSYTAKNNNITFRVIKKDSMVSVDADGAVYGHDAVISISVTDGVTGYVLVTIDNKTGKYDLTTPVIIITGNEYAAGLHNVSVTYVGDRKYNGAGNVTNFTVSKCMDYDFFVFENNTQVVNASVLDKLIDHTLVVDVNLPGDATGDLIFRLFENGSIAGSWNNILPKNLINYELRKETTYTLNITYSGDVNYESKVFTFDIHVYKDITESNVTFIPDIYNVRDNAVLNILSNLNGRVLKVYLDGREYGTLSVDNGLGSVDLGKLVCGNHTVTLKFDGDEFFTGLYESHVIFVSKLSSGVNVSAGSVRTGNPVAVEVNASGNGIANIVIFNNNNVFGSYNITVNNGKGSFIVPVDFAEGQYNVNITYYGDDIYSGNTNNTVFTVTDRIIGEINFIEPDLYIVNNTVIIGVNANFPAGTLNVFLDGKKVNNIVVSDYNAQLILGYLTAGNHNILVTYDGDYDWSGVSNNLTLDVVKYNSLVDVVINNPLYVDGLVEITVYVNETATGYVNVNVNNKDYHIKIKNHTARLNLTGLSYGPYTVSADYSGDDYYNANHATGEFTIARYTSNINIADITVGDDLQINITSFNGYDVSEVTGKFNITIGSVVLNNISISDGKIIIPVNKLPQLPDSYVVLAKYSGNYKFLPCDIETSININKLPAPVIIQVLSVTVGDDLNIILAGDSRYAVDGNVSVSFNSGEEFVLPVKDGVVCISCDKLPQVEGFNIIKLIYVNGTYYEDTVAEWSLYSDKITDYNFIITNQSVRFGENATLEINLPEDVNAELLVKINGIGNNVNIVNGYGKLENISGLHAGVNSVEAEFTSAKYETSTATGNIFVEPNDITLIITVPTEQLYADQSAVITLQANVTMNNNVTVYVNGEARTLKLTDGEGSFTINPLVYGKYVFTAIFNGNENYTYAAAAEKVFNVDKNNITLNVTADNIVVGNPVLINVNINSDATGLVIVKIDNAEYSLNVTDKEYVLSVPDLGNGTYSITAKYYGDDKYYGFENTTTVEVLKMTPVITADESILIGEDLTITVENITSLVGNATGRLNLIIDGFGTVESVVVDGVAVIKAYELPQLNDTYMASVVYYGDNNYYDLIHDISFTVNKVPGIVIYVPDNVTIDDELVIFVGDLTADGKLNVGVGSNSAFSVDVINGIAVIPVDKLPQASGNYDMSLYYYGGSYWDDAEYNAAFHADKVTVYPFTISNSTVKFGENATLEINLPNDVSATLTININEVPYNVDVENGYGVLENITGLNAGVNIVSVTFGSDKYETATATSTIFVEPNDITLTITVPTEQLYVDQSAVITLKANVTMSNSVTVYVNGRAETVKLTDGEGSFTIDSLVCGDYVFTAVFNGNENYTYAVAGEKSFSVNKLTSDFTVIVSDIFTGSAENISIVDLPVDAYGFVLVDVNGTVYSAKIINGSASISIDGLNYGNYSVVCTFTGDDKYIYSINNASFYVYVDTGVNVTIPEIIVNKTAVMPINLPLDATGSVALIVDGVLMNSTDLVNGSCVLNITGLDYGMHDIGVVYSGDVKYGAFNQTSSLKAKLDSNTNVTIPDNVDAGKTTGIPVNLPVNATGNVSLVVDGKVIYSKELINGSAVLELPDTGVGEHNISVVYSGDDNYGSFNKTGHVCVKPQKPDVPVRANTILKSKKKITFKASKRSKTKTFKFTLTSYGIKLSGKKVFFKLNKKALKTIKIKAKKGKKAKKAKKILKKLKKGKYSVKTKKGVATLKLLKSLFKFKKGKGKITATFKGDAGYFACKKVMNIVIK